MCIICSFLPDLMIYIHVTIPIYSISDRLMQRSLTFLLSSYLMIYVYDCISNVRKLGLWLRLECSLDCISGSVGHQQNIFIFSLSAFLLKLKKCN